MESDYFKDKKITVMGLGVARLLENPWFSTDFVLLSNAGKLEFSQPLSKTQPLLVESS